MTLAAAQKFIQTAVNDQDLVARINMTSDNAEVQKILSEMEIEFNYEEFELAYYNVLTWCQTSQQAEVVKEVKMWWDCLGFYMESLPS